jgi:hypothetical protein
MPSAAIAPAPMVTDDQSQYFEVRLEEAPQT